MADPYPPEPQRPSRSTTTIVVAVTLVVALVVSAAGLAGWAAWAFFRDTEETVAPQPPRHPRRARRRAAVVRAGPLRGSTSRTSTGAPAARTSAPASRSRSTMRSRGEDHHLAVLAFPPPTGPESRPARGQPGRARRLRRRLRRAGPGVVRQQLARYYDIVGFDPRGVGKSTPLDVRRHQADRRVPRRRPRPRHPGRGRDLDRLTREYGEGCLTHSGDLARHISTVEAAKDMDILRAALGERQLDYLGASYGTFLGATYADLFPTHVRRMVLDGAIDPALSNEQLDARSGRRLRDGRCTPTSRTASREGTASWATRSPRAGRRIRQLLDQIDAHPLPTNGGRELTEGLAAYGIILPLYVKSYWPLLTAALSRPSSGARRPAAARSPTSTPRAARTPTPTTPPRRCTP